MSWETKTLAEVADHSLGKMLDKVKNRGELLPYLANINVRWGEFELSDLRQMRFEQHEMERFGLRSGDILMCEGGEPGRCALWKGQRPGMMFQKAIHRIRPNENVDSGFLYYQFLYLGTINGFAPYFTGATIKHLPREQLARVPVRVTDLGTQRRIAAVLSVYDDLIATNQRRIALLEEAASRLYREWFVHLRFPGHEAVNLMDGVPEGWGRTTLGELADQTEGAVVQTGPFGSQLHSHEYVDFGTPVVMPQDIVRDRIRMDRISFVDEATARRLSRHALRPLDIVFPRRGDISKRAIVEEHQSGFICGTGCLKISFPTAPLHPVLLYHQLAEPKMVQWIEGQAVGTTMLNLSAAILRSVPCFIPLAEVQDMFVNFANQTRLQIDALEQQNAVLAEARDALLPKLMSGQLDVSSIKLPEREAA